jgi:WD40 repeat protein
VHSDAGTFTPTAWAGFTADERSVVGMITQTTSKATSPEGLETVVKWDASTGNQQAAPLKFKVSSGSSPNNMAVSPDGSFLATSVDSTVEVVDMKSFTRIHKLGGDKNGVSWLRFSPDGTSLLAGGYGGRLDVWRVPSFEHATEAQPLNGSVNSIEFGPDGRSLMVTGGNGQARILSWPSLEPIGTSLATGLLDADGWFVGNFAEGGALIVLVYAGGHAFQWPGSLGALRDAACRISTRNLTKTEWRELLPPTRPYEATCPGLP